MESSPSPSSRAARRAGLRYASDAEPGIRRVRRGKGFVYEDARGRLVRDAATLGRIRSIVIPPAWTDVWISPDPRGHVQATGRDARGRKQSRYHPRWREVRDAAKFDRMVAFGRALPRLRARVTKDVADGNRLSRRKVVATVVHLLDETLVRVGNDEYARENRSYGLTTLRDAHVAAKGRGIVFRFPGKGGKEHDVGVADPRVARVVVRCQDIPGQRLFQWVDVRGERHPVGSEDVNSYVRHVTGEDFTAKDFRTWAGTVIALDHLKGIGSPPSSKASLRKVANAAVDGVAERLRNTRAVCRASYIHPAVIQGCEAGTLWEDMDRCARGGRCPRGLREDEAQALLFLLYTAAHAREPAAAA